jgi:hypothetical protein
MARFAVELPISAAPAQAARAANREKPERPLTLLLVEPDAGAQRLLMMQLSARGHRVVPAAPDGAADLAQRLRFDAVLWSARGLAGRWRDIQSRVSPLVPSIVLVGDGYDRELATSIEERGGFLLTRPVEPAELDRLLARLRVRGNSSGVAQSGR